MPPATTFGGRRHNERIQFYSMLLLFICRDDNNIHINDTLLSQFLHLKRLKLKVTYSKQEVHLCIVEANKVG